MRNLNPPETLETAKKIKLKNMKQTIVILLLSFATIVNAQTEIPAEIITANNDTVKTKIVVKVDMFNKNSLYLASLVRKVITVNSSGTKTMLSPKSIKQLKFTDFQKSERVFKNNGDKLREVLHEGVLKAYLDYFVGQYGLPNSNIDFYDETGKRVKIGPLTTPIRVLKKLVKEKPELIAIIDSDNLSFENKVKIVLQKYEAEYLN